MTVFVLSTSGHSKGVIHGQHPISEFEHRVAKWAVHLKKTRVPLEVSRRGKTDLIVLDTETFAEMKADQERLQALEIKLLVDEGERRIRKMAAVSSDTRG